MLTQPRQKISKNKKNRNGTRRSCPIDSFHLTSSPISSACLYLHLPPNAPLLSRIIPPKTVPIGTLLARPPPFPITACQVKTPAKSPFHPISLSKFLQTPRIIDKGCNQGFFLRPLATRNPYCTHKSHKTHKSHWSSGLTRPTRPPGHKIGH